MQGETRLRLMKPLMAVVLVMAVGTGYAFVTAPIQDLPAGLRAPDVADVDLEAWEVFEVVAWLYARDVIDEEDRDRADVEGWVDIEELNRVIDATTRAPAAAETHALVSNWPPPSVVVDLHEILRATDSFGPACGQFAECPITPLSRALTAEALYGAWLAAHGRVDEASEALSAVVRAAESIRSRSTTTITTVVAAVVLLRAISALDCVLRLIRPDEAEPLRAVFVAARETLDAAWNIEAAIMHDWAYLRSRLVENRPRWWAMPSRRRIIRDLDAYHLDILAALTTGDAPPRPLELGAWVTYVDPAAGWATDVVDYDYVGRDRHLKEFLSRARRALDAAEAQLGDHAR